MTRARTSLPNIITVSRILLIPVFVVIYILPWEYSYAVATFFFAAAALTDWLDGYLARKLNQTTRFGAFLDPVADKLIVVSALVVLMVHYGNVWLTLPGLIIVGREIVISALREWMAEMNSSIAVAVSTLGKIKTTMQMIAIGILMAFPPDYSHPMVWLGFVIMYVAALMTLWSMTMYLKAAWPTLSESANIEAD